MSDPTWNIHEATTDTATAEQAIEDTLTGATFTRLYRSQHTPEVIIIDPAEEDTILNQLEDHWHHDRGDLLGLATIDEASAEVYLRAEAPPIVALHEASHLIAEGTGHSPEWLSALHQLATERYGIDFRADSRQSPQTAEAPIRGNHPAPGYREPTHGPSRDAN